MGLELRVQGMTCQNCVRHVTDALRSVTHVTDVEVALPAHAAVQGNPDHDELIAALVAAGYGGEVLA